MQLDKLKRIDLREAWNHEALDFTNWLAREDNLAQLGDEIGISIRLKQVEAPVGSFNVDILAEDEDSNNIVIENQLESTDHDHLGKIIVYASGHDAKKIIWIVKEAREEHRKAIDWLNDHTDDKTEFYLVQIELWQIQDSPLAPKFQLIAKPNDWAKTVKKSGDTRELTETKLKQLEFWNSLKEYAKKKKSRLRFQKSNPQHWTSITIGTSEAFISLTINSKENTFGTELYIPDNKELFQSLENHKTEIEELLGEPAEWMELPGKKASRIKVSFQGSLSNEEGWSAYFDWLIQEAEKFQKIFSQFLKTLSNQSE